MAKNMKFNLSLAVILFYKQFNIFNHHPIFNRVFIDPFSKYDFKFLLHYWNSFKIDNGASLWRNVRGRPRFIVKNHLFNLGEYFR
jgi:hypothetical protein